MWIFFQVFDLHYADGSHLRGFNGVDQIWVSALSLPALPRDPTDVWTIVTLIWTVSELPQTGAAAGSPLVTEFLCLGVSGLTPGTRATAWRLQDDGAVRRDHGLQQPRLQRG